jgi:ABC-type transport system involved in cytochrome c biogenesis ATPase subunit
MARLLVRRSECWLLDEPYASLDDAGCRRVDELIARQLEHGGVILATHQRHPCIDPEQIEQVVLEYGHASETGE